MSFTKEIVDFSGLSNSDIKKKLNELNIPLTVEEALKIQNEMLGRAPSLAELILFSIQGSEHCSYKSSRNHLKSFTTEKTFTDNVMATGGNIVVLNKNNQ